MERINQELSIVPEIDIVPELVPQIEVDASTDVVPDVDSSVEAESDEEDFAPITALLESLLFVSEEPVEPADFARALALPLQTVEVALETLRHEYSQNLRGLRLQERNGRFQLVTMPEAASVVENFLNLNTTTKLSGPALEALAIIAYRQPVTRSQIEAVRGVDCGGVLRTLSQRALIEEIGRLEVPGRPLLYSVTDLFMQHFGLTELNELPTLATEDADMLWAATQLAEIEGAIDPPPP